MRRIIFILVSLATLAVLVQAAPVPPAARKNTHQSASRYHAASASHRTVYESGRNRLAAERHARYEAELHARYEAARHARYQAQLHDRYETERHDRYVDLLSARYEEGYNAGYAAGQATARRELAGMIQCRPAPASPSPALRPSDTDTANLAPARPVAPAQPPAPAAAQPATTAQSATYNTSQAVYYPPVTMKASLLMLREPFPPPLRGSLASLERQNRRLDAEGLSRVQNDGQLEQWVSDRLLVPLPVSAGLMVNPSLPSLRRYCRPWTAQFLADLASIHNALFHRPLVVDSAVRPVSYQERLMEINGNAAPAYGEVASPHETGATIDIGKVGMTRREIGWMRRYLLVLQDAGLIDVEEEFEQACFHITVYDVYSHGRFPRPVHRDDGADTASIDSPTPAQ